MTTTHMTTSEALYALGVRDDTLSAEEKLKLDHDGFLPLHGILSQAQIADMLVEIGRLFEREKTARPGNPSECGNLQNKSAAFDVCITHPRVLAAIAHVLKEDFRSRGVHTRPNSPGRGHQGLHADYNGPPPQDGEYDACNSIWPLVDFTVENGATRVVPGSHRNGKNPGDEMRDPTERHPQEIKLVAPGGSVVIFNSHLWHGATQNNSRHCRPNVTSFWGRRKFTHGQSDPNYLSREAHSRLSEPVRTLFDGVEPL
jgi:hypothetical protein